jgi:hypothetical protein
MAACHPAAKPHGCETATPALVAGKLARGVQPPGLCARLKTAATTLRQQEAIRNISLDTCKRNKWIDQFHFLYHAYAFLHITDWTELILDGIHPRIGIIYP